MTYDEWKLAPEEERDRWTRRVRKFLRLPDDDYDPDTERDAQQDRKNET